ncbi:Cytochrome c2 (Cyc7) (PDB:1YEA) [Commensalibacter communis]|uniref:c-type cytochrome n=1 Tax=Commensalibacter communis TaxID=2972786 RepID=UPI0022FF8106|nr:c-type cytochrome [Commensalibacter communis]CAI3940030.1 Cytochrome c2 (Cyc7) (PDB:1YEA) [Commensalibacter communis]
MDSFDWNRLAVAGLFSVCVLAASWGIGSVVIQNQTQIKSVFSNDSDQNESIDLASANPAKGRELATQQCSLCHTFNENGANKIGPNLYGVMGHKIASKPNFNYSDSLKKHQKESWDVQNLNLWLAHPTNFAPDTIMAYPGISVQQDRIDVIAYLKTISPSAPSSASVIEKKDNSDPREKSYPEIKSNLSQGKEEFQQYCAVCHTDTVEGNTRLGPNLYNIVNKPIASQSNYTYSGSLKLKKMNWTESNLDQWIENPQQWAPGNKMNYKGISSADIRKNIILYLYSLSPQDKN